MGCGMEKWRELKRFEAFVSRSRAQPSTFSRNFGVGSTPRLPSNVLGIPRICLQLLLYGRRVLSLNPTCYS
jgi:hypothetical protein